MFRSPFPVIQLSNEVSKKTWEAKSLLNLATLKPFELHCMVLLTYEHLEQIRCVLQSLLTQVQLPAKLVGKSDSFFQYTTPELYTYPTFVLKKQRKKDQFVALTLIHMGFFRATIYEGFFPPPLPSKKFLTLLRIQYNFAQLQIKSFLACSAIWV